MRVTSCMVKMNSAIRSLYHVRCPPRECFCFHPRDNDARAGYGVVGVAGGGVAAGAERGKNST